MKKALHLLTAVIFFLGVAVDKIQAQCNAPIVNNFSPNTGFIGSTVTISGANFDANPGNNIVYFGATKAVVTQASFGQLKVTVPVGASTAPISVTNPCNKTAYSAVSFNGIFCPTPIAAQTYNNTAFTLSGYGAYNMLSQDMDLDGKPDVISARNDGGITIAINNSTPGNLNFSAYNFTTGNAQSIYAADFDGDGKRDLATTYYIYRNTSTGQGNFSMTYATGSSSVSGYQIAAGDFNGDGKIDLVGEQGSNMWIALNTSTGPGNISFGGRQFLAGVGATCTGIQVADVDGDGKTDILASQGNANRAVSIRNITTPGSNTITVEAPEYWSTNGNYPYRCQIADFDKDGKIDLTTCNYNAPANTCIFRNTSTVGNINFAGSVNLAAPQNNYRIQVGDVNGDGLPDIVTKSLGVNVFSVYPNTSTGPGSVTFGTRYDYTSSDRAEVSGIVIGDLDGDFVPDIATSGISSNTIRFHRNTSSQQDLTPPTAICKSITVALSPTGTVNVLAAMIDNGSSDACGIGSLLINDAASINFTCANIGPNAVTLKVTDRGGNISTCQATVTVAPAAVIVSGQTTVCQGQTVAMQANLGDSYQWQKNGVDIQGATLQNYTATVSGDYSVSVTNAGGCSGTSAPVTITVNNNPTVNTTPSGNASLCNGSLVLSSNESSIYQWKLNGNNIAGATQQNFNATASGNYSVQVIDLFGCSATSSNIVVNATDNVAPTITCPANITVNTVDANGASATYTTPTATDNCSSVAVSRIAGLVSGSTFPIGVNTVTYRATDAAGNSSECSFTVTVVGIAPAIVSPGNQTAVAAIGTCGAVVNFTATETTGNPASTISYSQQPGSVFPVGETIVTATATNVVGRSTTTFTVNVADNEAPKIACPDNITVIAISALGSPVLYAEPIASDNCSGVTLLRIAGGTSGSIFPLGTTTVTYRATDGSGNSTDCSFTIKVVGVPPVILSPGNQSASAATGTCGASVNFAATEILGIPTSVISYSQQPGSIFPVGNTIVTATATNAVGSSSTSFSVTVTDNQTPTVLVNNVAVTLVNGAASVTAAQINNGSFDNCGIQSVQLTGKTAYTCADLGQHTVTLTITDIHGNVASANAVVTVNGALPTASINPIPANNTYTGGVPTNLYLGYGPQSLTLQTTATGGAPYSYSWTGNGTLSNTTAANPVFTATASGSYTFTVTVTNVNGCKTTANISICVRDIRVIDAKGNGSSGKVYLCHVPPGNSGNPHVLSISVNAVNAHLTEHPGDRLGACGMPPCSIAPVSKAEVLQQIQSVSVEEREEVNELQVIASPNPTSSHFELVIRSQDKISPVQVRVSGMDGKVLTSVRTNVGQKVIFGQEYNSGVYIAEVIQGSRRKTVKLIKSR